MSVANCIESELDGKPVRLFVNGAIAVQTEERNELTGEPTWYTLRQVVLREGLPVFNPVYEKVLKHFLAELFNHAKAL